MFFKKVFCLLISVMLLIFASCGVSQEDSLYLVKVNQNTMTANIYNVDKNIKVRYATAAALKEEIKGDYKGNAVVFTCVESGHQSSGYRIKAAITEAEFEQAQKAGYKKDYFWIALTYDGNKHITLTNYNDTAFNDTFRNIQQDRQGKWIQYTMLLTSAMKKQLFDTQSGIAKEVCFFRTHIEAPYEKVAFNVYLGDVGFC